MTCPAPEPDKEKMRERIRKIYQGLQKRFSDPKDFLDPDLLEALRSANKEVLPSVRFERSWNDHFKLIEAIIEANNKDSIFIKARYKKLGNMGILLITEVAEGVKASDTACSGECIPFAVFLAANVKLMFRDLSVKLRPTVYKGRIAETEITMQ
jgi:hypothetical protein